MSVFDSVEQLPEDPILGINEQFAQDPRSNKVNLGVGAYKNAEGSPQVLTCVRVAEHEVLQKNLTKEYQPIIGDASFISETLKFIFGEDSPIIAAQTAAAAQTIGATGALRLGADFLLQSKISDTIFLSDPTWPNHKALFKKAGMKIESYPYYDYKNHSFNFYAMQQSIEKMPTGSTILLQPCCHNPTGTAPLMNQWKELAEQIRDRQIIPFFDFAYHGFDQGLTQDSNVVRLFVEVNRELLIAYTYSKNLGLYGERIGLLSLVSNDFGLRTRVLSHIKRLIRGSYSSPPLQGERIVTTILQSDELRKEWKHELAAIRSRIKEMRVALVSGLRAKGCNRFDHLDHQTGMFTCTGLGEDRVNRLRKEFGIYMPKSGRINLAGLNWKNMEYVIDSFLSVVYTET